MTMTGSTNRPGIRPRLKIATLRTDSMRKALLYLCDLARVFVKLLIVNSLINPYYGHLFTAHFARRTLVANL